jgi:hypothetical protein
LPKLPPHQLFIASLVGLISFTICMWTLWEVAASRYNSVLDTWINMGRAAGYQISYDDRSLFGFPRRIVVRLVNVRWRTADGIDFSAGDMDISAFPWQWQNFHARFKHQVHLSAPVDEDGRTLTLGGEEGHADVKLDDDGIWRVAHIALQQSQLGLTPHYIATANQLMLAAMRPLQEPKDHTQPGLTVNGEADQVALPAAISSPFGLQMPQLQFKLRVMGPVPDFRRRASVDAWNKDSGVVEFDTLAMHWGPLQMTAKGTMGFDDDLQPEGAFASAIGDHKKVFQALLAGGQIPQSQAGMLDSALTLFAKPGGSAKDKLELPITVQLGGLFLGPVRLFVFPPIEWPKAGEPGQS